MAAAASAGPWVWHEVVPERLEPFQGQVLFASGAERWDRWGYVLLEWTDASNRVACRHCGHVEYSWNPGRGWYTRVLPSMPAPGSTLVVREATTRPVRGSLVHLDEGGHDIMNLWWRIRIHGCYVPPASDESALGPE